MTEAGHRSGRTRRVAVVTASNRAAAGVYSDRSGTVIVERLRESGYAVVGPWVVPDGPPVTEALLRAPNLIITPHVGSSALVSRMAGVQHARDNLLAHFAGRPIKDRVA